MGKSPRAILGEQGWEDEDVSEDVLSQDEVESLLNAMSESELLQEAMPPPAEPAEPDQPAEPVGSIEPAEQEEPAPVLSVVRNLGEKVATYDFKRPERVGKEQMRALQTLHEGFGRNFAAGLSAMLRSMVEVKLTSVDQLTYGEFVFSLENPTCFNLLSAKPLDGNLILDINPSILYPIIDRLLGGGQESSSVAHRPLTEIELRLVGRITGLFLTELQLAWENVIALEFEVVRVESNPQLVQVVPPNEVVILVSFELALGEHRGMINLCIPYNSIERISSKLSDNSWVSYGRHKPTEETVKRIGRNLQTSLVELKVGLAGTRITTKDLIGLRVGDIITTDKDVHCPLVASVEGVPKFHASPGAFKGHKAIRIDGILAKSSASGESSDMAANG